MIRSANRVVIRPSRHSPVPSARPPRRCRWLACVAALASGVSGVLGATAAAAGDPARASLLSDPLVENYQPEVQVSGNVVVGLMWASAIRGLPSDAIGVAPSAGAKPGVVCLRVVSRDGIYSSRNEYRLPEAAPGTTVLLPYRSRHGDLLHGYADDELAMTASPGACSETPTHYHVVTGPPGEPDGELRVYVNSFGATDVFYQRKSASGWSAPIACSYISEGRRTTFDSVCGIPAASVRGGDLDLRIVRERFGREQPAVELHVLGSR